MPRYPRYSDPYDRPGRMYGNGNRSPARSYPPAFGAPARRGFGLPPSSYLYSDFLEGGMRSAYDGDFKSRWQRDHGDPFRDRERHTPIRVVQGGYDAAAGYPRSMRYDRQGYARRGGSGPYDRQMRW